MSKIFQFPSLKVQKPKTPEENLPADVLAGKDFDYRGEWDRAVPILSKKAFNIDRVLAHEVSIATLGVGAAIAQYLKKDNEAALYLNELASILLLAETDTFPLSAVSSDYRGYVWTLDSQHLANASSLVRLRLGRIIDRPLEQTFLIDL